MTIPTHKNSSSARSGALFLSAILLMSTFFHLAPTAAAADKPTAKPDQQAPKAAKPAQPILPTKVVVDAVRQEPLHQTVPVLGRFVARQTGVIATRINGAVGELRVDVGDRVDEGEVLAVLLKDRLQWQHNLQRAEVANFAAQLKTKKQQIKLRRQELERLKSLKKSPAFSQARLDDKSQEVAVAESEANEANAMLQMANANFRLTGIDLHNAEITAPYAGVVSKRHADVGAYMTVGAPLVTIIDDQTMEIEADVPAERIAALSAHTKVPAVINKKSQIMAMVRAVVPEENPQTRTRTVRFIPVLQDGKFDLAANQSVTLHLPAGSARHVITVHKDAVINRKGKQLVVVAVEATTQFRPVVLGEATGSRFSVIKGLKPGELVVVRGNERLLPGTPLEFSPPSPAPAAGTNKAREATPSPEKIR